MTFVNQTKEVLHGVQVEIRKLKTTVNMMAKEMQADCEAQTKAAGAADRKLNKAAAAIGKLLVYTSI